MKIALALIGALVALYLIINGKRNSDPLNRKCAAEICELITSRPDCSPQEIATIFVNNARFNTQAGHVVSMVPALLIKAGYPQQQAMSVVPLLRAAQLLVPK